MSKHTRSAKTEASTSPNPPQLTLPRQSHTAEGPHDQTGMYVMHHAFRRDLENFVRAVQNTPSSEHEVWTALERRWLRMAEVLHHHHTIEDASLWPVLRSHAEEAGAEQDLQMLEDMEAEHEVIDPGLAACREAFGAMSGHPCEDHRHALEIRLGALRERRWEHLAHEEGQALPMLQRTLSVEENRAFERAAERGYPLRMLPFLLPWAMDEVPDKARERLFEQTPPGYGLLLRLLRPRFERAERKAFRYT